MRFWTARETTPLSTYAELDRRARSIAASLQGLEIPGRPVLLAHPPGPEYIAAFFGCLYAGIVAVPAYPPRSNRTMSRLRAIVADTKSTALLTTKALPSRIAPRLEQFQSPQPLRLFATDDMASGMEDYWRASEVSAGSLAVLQYTSGSTGTPKGVMLSHGNLLHNSALLHHACATPSAGKIISWLPPYHDMGLIGGVLQPLYGGVPCILMSPASFLQNPLQLARSNLPPPSLHHRRAQFRL